MTLRHAVARIVTYLAVPLPRRRRDDTTVEPAFIELKHQCLALLRDAE